MNLKLTPAPLSGVVNAIDSKSELHRILICSALSNNPCKIITSVKPDNLSNDVKTTIDCLSALGAVFEFGDREIDVKPIKDIAKDPVLDCRESGSTLRFLLPVATALCDKVTFKGNERLSERPIGSLKTAMEAHGVKFSGDVLPFTTKGKLTPGQFEITGDLTSQYLSGLLLALPLLNDMSTIRLTTPLLSRGYVELTIKTLADFGIAIMEPIDQTFSVYRTEKRYISPREIKVEGDWSNAAFFFVANYLGNDIDIENLNFHSLQRDKEILNYLSGDIEEIDLTNTPDLLPALSVVVAYGNVKTTFKGAARLRLKESDRLTSVCEMIKALGGKAEDTDDGLIVYPQPLTGGTVESYGDHRIVMAATIASTRCEEPVIINEARAVNKSYPTFFDDIKSLGGVIDVI